MISPGKARRISSKWRLHADAPLDRFATTGATIEPHARECLRCSEKLREVEQGADRIMVYVVDAPDQVNSLRSDCGSLAGRHVPICAEPKALLAQIARIRCQVQDREDEQELDELYDYVKLVGGREAQTLWHFNWE